MESSDVIILNEKSDDIRFEGIKKSPHKIITAKSGNGMTFIGHTIRNAKEVE